ncbi:MAG: hypothetical protein H7A45_18245 [Verrucomicrobiales bacterium]|nr:hypothetical protein [Verrucomicrobiales bacterium]
MARLIIWSAVLVGTSAALGASWKDRLSVKDGGEPPAWDAGAVYPMLDGGQGFALIADSPMEVVNGSYPIASAARFDAQANLLWAAYLDTGDGAREQELSGPGDELDTLFAGYINEAGAAVMGLVDGAQLDVRFAHQVALSVPPDQASLHIFPDLLSVLLQDTGTSVRMLVVDADGNRVFEREYQSAAFEGGAFGGIPGLGGLRALSIAPLPDRTGYVVCVHSSEQTIGGGFPPTLANANYVATLCLNRDGTVRWANRFNLISGGVASVLLGTAEDNSILYRILETGFDLGTLQAVSRTHLIKLSNTGALGWARTIDGAQIVAVNFSTDGGYWFSGTRTVTLNPPSTDLAVLRVNPDTGALEAQAILNQGTYDSGSLAGISADRVFVGLQSAADPTALFAQAGHVVALDRNLGFVDARRYRDPIGFASLAYSRSTDELLYSAFRFTDNAIDVVSLTPGLNAAAGCELFDPAEIAVAASGLTAQALSLSVETATVQTVDHNSALEPGELPVAALEIERVSICGGSVEPEPPQLSLQAASGGDGLALVFSSSEGIQYVVRRADAVTGPYATEATLAGTGGPIEHPVDTSDGEAGFYYVEALDP